MTLLRSALNPEEQPNALDGQTSYKVRPNQWELFCAVCGGSYYVDDRSLKRATAAMEEGHDNPFCCNECESEYEAMFQE